MWHFENAERLDVLKDFDPVLFFAEETGFNLERFLVVMNLLQCAVIRYNLLIEVVLIELESVHSISHFLSAIVGLRFVDFNTHHL